MKYSRRSFIKTGLVGIGGLSLSKNLFSKGSQSPSFVSSFHDPYEIITLGKTEMKTTRLGLGTGIKGYNKQSNLTRLGSESAIELIRKIYDSGVRFFDCADGYGSHFVIGEALKDKKRSDYLIFTKIWYHNDKNLDINEATERFLRELQTDYIDGLLLHCVTDGDWNTKNSELMVAMSKLKQKGMIRSHGLSCHSLDAIKTAAKESWVDTCHVRINPFGVNMDDSIENVLPAVQSLHEAGKGVIGMKIYGEGKFAEDPEKKDQSLTFALQSGIVDILNLGMDKFSDLSDTEKRIKRIAK